MVCALGQLVGDRLLDLVRDSVATFAVGARRLHAIVCAGRRLCELRLLTESRSRIRNAELAP